MADDKTKRGGQDRTRINVSEDYEVRDWAKRLDVTPEQLRRAVKAVGARAADVEMFLKGSHATTDADQVSRADSNARREE